MKIFFYALILITTLAGSHAVSAQQRFITLSGRITDAATALPVPFASIQLKSGKTGTATNDRGDFLFKMEEIAIEDTLIVSCVGYRTLYIAVRQVKQDHPFALEPAAIELAAVTVNPESGVDILKRAIAKIPVNVDTSSIHLTAFYREQIRLGDFELSYVESVLDILKVFHYEKDMNDQIRIIKGRKKDIAFPPGEGQLYYMLAGISNGARGSLGDDMIKYHNHSVSPFNPRNFRYYDIDYIGSIKDQDRNLIVIEILPKNRSPKGLFKVKVFIEEESMAIVKFDLECSEAGVRRISRKDKGVGYAIMSTLIGASLDYHKFKVSVGYKEYNGKWYLSNIKRHFEILVNSKKRNMADRPWVADIEFLTTDIDTTNSKPIREGNIGDNEGRMNSIITNDDDPAFWENFNILKPAVRDSVVSWTEAANELRPAPVKHNASNRENGFTRADTLRGMLTPLRTCYDVTFYHLDVKVDIEARAVAGNNLIRFKVIQPFRKMQVDLYNNMVIDKILLKGDSLPFTREHNAVFISLPDTLKAGSQEEIRIYYHGIPKTPDFAIPMDGGVLWDNDSLGNVWAQVVCQGSGASLWWPNKDHQSDEPDSMKIWITVPSEYSEISNGRLMRKQPVTDGHTRYEWYVSYPINNYNVTFNIGKYAHYRDLHITDDTLTLDYYVMPYNIHKAKRMFRQVKPMLEIFERNFGKYPFPRDGFALVESLYPMEHQSGVCIGKITTQTDAMNPLLWHESAHEWWGNAITTRDIADMWVHEAFATYAEGIVVEGMLGKELALSFLSDQVRAVKNREPVIGVYNVNHIYYDIGDMYSKGSLMLHTFRSVLNDDLKWVQLLRGIQDHFRYQTLSSDEFVEFINQFTGSDYHYLFDQYLKYTSIPELQMDIDQKGKDLVVKHRWKADVGDFRMPVRVYTGPERSELIYPDKEWKTVTLKNTRSSDFYADEENFYIAVSESGD